MTIGLVPNNELIEEHIRRVVANLLVSRSITTDDFEVLVTLANLFSFGSSLFLINLSLAYHHHHDELI